MQWYLYQCGICLWRELPFRKATYLHWIIYLFYINKNITFQKIHFIVQCYRIRYFKCQILKFLTQEIVRRQALIKDQSKTVWFTSVVIGSMISISGSQPGVRVPPGIHEKSLGVYQIFLLLNCYPMSPLFTNKQLQKLKNF